MEREAGQEAAEEAWIHPREDELEATRDGALEAATRSAEAAEGLRSAAERYRTSIADDAAAARRTAAAAIAIGLDALHLATVHLGGCWYDGKLRLQLKATIETSMHQPAYATARDLAAILLAVCDEIEGRP